MTLRLRRSLIAVLALVVVLAGCQIANERAGRGSRVNPPATPAPGRTAAPPSDAAAELPVQQPTAPIPAAPVKPRRQVSPIAGEPQIGVLLAAGPQVVLTLPRPAILEFRNTRVQVPAGDVRFDATSKGLRTAAAGKTDLGNHAVIRIKPVAGQPAFTAMLTPPNGKPVRLTFAGTPEIHLDPASRKAQLIERIGMEDYLASVLATEVNPSWPLEALKAQAITARSYALDRYLQADDQPWQLHWHYTVDMAYGGMKAAPRAIVTTMAQTRGWTLTYQGLPVPALFHACSGGRTESAKHFRPDLTGADGVTDMTAVMPSVDDPAGITGAEALGFTTTHLNWRAEVPLARITSGLKEWAADHPLDRLAFGTVIAVRMATRFNDSGRVATVTVRHLLGNKELDSEFSAADFRLAVGPGLVRSTNWTRCAGVAGGVVVIEGRGYGHGVGMSQISAYQLARTGSAATDIVKRFYPGAGLVQLWR